MSNEDKHYLFQTFHMHSVKLPDGDDTKDIMHRSEVKKSHVEFLRESLQDVIEKKKDMDINSFSVFRY